MIENDEQVKKAIIEKLETYQKSEDSIGFWYKKIK